METVIERWVNKLIWGDCLQVMKRLPDKSVQAVITDPPYSVNINYGPSVDDHRNDYYEWIEELINEFKRISDNNLIIVLGSFGEILRRWWNFIPDAKLIIVKMGALSRNCQKGLHLQYHCVLSNIKSKEYKSDLWEDVRWPGEGYFFNEPRYGHPAMTPLKLAKRLIHLYTNSGQIIFEPFSGVGTIPVACISQERKFIAVERELRYIGIARKRVQAAAAQGRLF
jgi:DNA modification methylase